jgi:hypothetical protein
MGQIDLINDRTNQWIYCWRIATGVLHNEEATSDMSWPDTRMCWAKTCVRQILTCFRYQAGLCCFETVRSRMKGATWRLSKQVRPLLVREYGLKSVRRHVLIYGNRIRQSQDIRFRIGVWFPYAKSGSCTQRPAAYIKLRPIEEKIPIDLSS